MGKSEEIKFYRRPGEYTTDWEGRVINGIRKVTEDFKWKIDYTGVIFLSREELLEINRKYLEKDNYTDVICFNYSEKGKNIDGEIYVSQQDVEENARNFGETFEREMARVILHGFLHFVGVNDTTKEEKEKMREVEEKYLSKCFT